jgi:hypothetical protein
VKHAQRTKGEWGMGLTVLKKKSFYALGGALGVFGVMMLLIVVWKWWDASVFSNPANMVPAITSSFETELLGSGTEVTILHGTIIGIVCLIAGSAILVMRREKITVTEEVTTLLECPLCKNQWQEAMSKTHLESIGYPKVRTLSRHRCPKCAKFIRPKIVKTGN